MKIGYDAKRAFFNFRGLGNYSRTLIQSLAMYYRDGSYRLYTPFFDDNRSSEYQNTLISLKEEDSSLKICFPEKKIFKKLSGIWRSFFLTSQLKKDQLDIYHGLSHELPYGIDKLNLKSVVTIHDLIFLRYPHFFPWIDRVIYKKKFSYSTKVADKVVAICEQTKKDLVDYLNVDPLKIEVVYQSCDPRFYSNLIDGDREKIRQKYNLKEKGFFLNVGALEERKNTFSLVKAFLKIKDKTNNNLVLVGRGKSYLDKIKSFIKLNSLENRVLILEDVSMEELPYIYSLAKIMVYPSLFEGFGIPIIESLFTGTPVITSKGSCFKESGGPGALYVDPLNIEELALTMIKLDENWELLEKLAKDGLDFVQKFHWKNTSKVMNNLYTELLNHQ